MKSLLPVIALLFVACSNPYIEEIEKYRKGRNQEFIAYESSPIPEYKRSYFEGLNYFAPSEDGKVIGEFHTFNETDSIPFNTGETTVYYQRKGKVEFQLKNQTLALVVYESPKNRKKNQLFIPFSDLTSGKTTYGAGRYLYSYLEADSTVVLDFNYARNPYCAYNEQFVCFPAPQENKLPVEVDFGEKIYQIH